jgi:hypothetical protein
MSIIQRIDTHSGTKFDFEWGIYIQVRNLWPLQIIFFRLRKLIDESVKNQDAYSACQTPPLMGRNHPQGKGQIYREYSVTKTRIFASPSRKQANLQSHYRVSVAAIRQGSNIPKRDWELLVIERSSQEIRGLLWSNTATFSFLNATSTLQGGASKPMVHNRRPYGVIVGR